MTWNVARARDLAESCLDDMGDRWLHVQAVGRSAEELQARGLDVSDAVVMAAWLHDVGYGESVADTGFHPVDGARWLVDQGAPPGVVALVAHHSGARFEAEERGLADALAQFPEPDPDQLDVLTLIDMSTSPAGKRVAVSERLDEILNRYPPADPVHRAVTRSRGSLQESAKRAAERLGLADVRAGTSL
jgi:HD superfamily phosphodiesterase